MSGIERFFGIRRDEIVTKLEVKIENVMPIIPSKRELPERPNIAGDGQKLLWYPVAIKPPDRMKTKGDYRYGYPQGAVVHFTAGSSAQSSLDWGREQGYCFFVISEDGTVYQSFPLNEWGHHAGSSSYPSLQGSVSDELVGIEIACAGRLESQKNGMYKSWFGKQYRYDQVREIREQRDNQQPGVYHKYTIEQELALEALLLWLKRNNPGVFDFNLVLGHDEVAPGRKNDPGGSLSMTMPEFRERLKTLSASVSVPHL